MTGFPLESLAMSDAWKAAERAMRRLNELGTFSDDSAGLTRLYLSPAHKVAARLVAAWMEHAGMSVEIDAVGNVVGRYAGTDATAKTLIIGSHIDTVRNAGKHDGPLGVIVGIEAVAALHARNIRYPFAIEVVAFGDEEGVRFPVTLTGSRALAGTLDPATLDSADRDGITIRAALAAFGCSGDVAGVARDRDRVLGYLEVHIEQGPVLEAENLPVGAVSAIAGASRAIVKVTGMAGHAGTVPMTLRRDAAAAAAEMMLAVERQALETKDLVATVGRIEVRPGAPNVVAGEALFTVDMRSPDDAVRGGAFERLRADCAAIASRRAVKIDFVQTYDQAAVICDPHLATLWDDAVQAQGFRPFRLPSGAGHDGLAMVALCPVSMLFVRCRGGISHNPAESVKTDDVEIAIAVLQDMIARLGRT